MRRKSASPRRISEMVRQEMIKRYGENAYTDGYKVYTTVTKRLQLAAQGIGAQQRAGL